MARAPPRPQKVRVWGRGPAAQVFASFRANPTPGLRSLLAASPWISFLITVRESEFRNLTMMGVQFIRVWCTEFLGDPWVALRPAVRCLDTRWGLLLRSWATLGGWGCFLTSCPCPSCPYSIFCIPCLCTHSRGMMFPSFSCQGESQSLGQEKHLSQAKFPWNIWSCCPWFAATVSSWERGLYDRLS